MNTRKKSIVAGYTEPDKEDIWLNSKDNKLYFYSSKGWVEIGTTPTVKTKQVCDMVYTLRKSGPPFNPVYTRTGDFTTENCQTVDEDCEVTYTSVLDKLNLIETVTATHLCPVLQELTREQFVELGGVPADVPMGETIIIK